MIDMTKIGEGARKDEDWLERRAKWESSYGRDMYSDRGTVAGGGIKTPSRAGGIAPPTPAYIPSPTPAPSPSPRPPSTPSSAASFSPNINLSQPSQPYPPADSGAASFPYPPELDVASNVMGRYSTGVPPYEAPGQWGEASDIFSRYGEGTPTTQGAWWEAMQPVVQRSIEDQAKQAAEQAGLGGLRWSSPLQRNITDIAGREMAGLGAQWTDRELMAQEAAASRAMQAGSGLGNIGGQYAQREESAANRAMQAAGGLGGLAQQYFQMPMDWSAQMYGMGTGMQGLSQQALGREYQDWQSMQPWASPWTSLGMNYAGMQSQMAPQQYQPSPFGQFMGGLGGLAGAPFMPWNK